MTISKRCILGLFGLAWWLNLKRPLETLILNIKTKKLTGSIRLAVLSDTHSSDFGAQASELIRLLQGLSLDAILLVGDIFDDVRRNDKTLELLKELPALAQVFYVSGNHDQLSRDYSQIPELLERLGIEFLDGKTKTVLLRNESITISGLADPQSSASVFMDQAKRIAPSEHFHVLLSHRPQLMDVYQSLPVDLLVSGHAHGGQWQLFGRGVYSPGQGLFPRFTKGLYATRPRLVVSPGLMRNILPRFFNPPTVTIINIQGES